LCRFSKKKKEKFKKIPKKLSLRKKIQNFFQYFSKIFIWSFVSSKMKHISEKNLELFFENFSMSLRKKISKFFVEISQKILYGHLFHQKWNIFRKKFFELFLKNFILAEVPPKK